MTTFIIIAAAAIALWFLFRKREGTTKRPAAIARDATQLSRSAMTREEQYAWRNFGRKLDSLKSELDRFQYRSIFEASGPGNENRAGNRDVFLYHDVPRGALPLDQIAFILSEDALASPHGLDLLRPLPSRNCPKLPQIPDRSLMKEYEAHLIAQYEELEAGIEAAKRAYAAKASEEEKSAAKLAAQCASGDISALNILMRTTLARHSLPAPLSLGGEFVLDGAARVALCTIEVPEFFRLPIVNKRGGSHTAKWLPVSEAEKRRSSERILQSLCVRAAYLVAMSDPANLFDTVAVNAHQAWFDPATGNQRDGIIASLQALKVDIQKLQPGHLDPKACFRHLAGISTPNSLDATPIRPIFVFNTDDNRIVANRDVASGLEQETNLATMPWEDFEHLVRQLFEWMFTNDGVEVKVTRASRDRGVDAIMFDPDPVRGGKYVLQAKRYTRTVDVAAVRDLYGTIVNEGANRGILVTTATYGPDSYEFAKNKPISLIDGPNLISLLRKHGRYYRVDLEEARRAETSSHRRDTTLN